MRLPRTARKAVRVKGKKGKVGHDGRSSLANPKSSRYRNAASARMSGPQMGSSTANTALGVEEAPGSGLTREMLSQFDSEQREKVMDAMSLCLDSIRDEDEESAAGGALTFRSIASNLTQCSNPSFERVLRAWSGNSQQQNSVLAVLAGLTQVIKEKGGSGTNVEYFALLVKAVETFADTADCENVAATAFLLKLIIGRVPAAVLRAEFPRVSRSLVRVLSNQRAAGGAGLLPDGASVAAASHSASHDAALAKATLACLGVLLRAQDWSVWSGATTRAVFQCLLRFVVDSRARVRKAAHLSVVGVMRSGEEKGRPHPAGPDAVRTLLPLITAAPAPGEPPKRALWALSLLGSILSLVSAAGVQEACEKALLPLMAQPGQPMVRLHAIRALHGLFAGFPSEERLSAERNGKLLTALYNMQPPKNSEDIGTMKAWMTTARAGLYNLLKLGRPRLVAPHLSRLFPLCVDVLGSPVTGMHGVAAHAALRLLDDVLKELLSQTEARSMDDEEMAELLGVKETGRVLLQLLAATRSALKFQFVEAWPQVLRLMAGVVSVWGRVSSAAEAEGGKAAAFWRQVEEAEFGEALRLCLRQLSAMRDERVETKMRPANATGAADAAGGEHVEADLERILGVAVQALGPQEFLRIVPLNMSREAEDGELNLTRSWVLPLLLSHGMSSKRQTSLKYFFEQLCPVAEKFLKQKEEAEEELVDADRPGARLRLLETLYSQVWSLLPVFCSRPVELSQETFLTVGGKKTPTMVQALQAMLKRLSERQQLRRPVVAAIRRLVACEKRLTAEEGSSAPRLMRRYAKNVLPALFNVYVETVDTADGTAVIDAVREYAPLVEEALVQRWYSAARRKVAEEEQEARRRAELDLLVCLAPHLPDSELQQALDEDCLRVIRDEEQTPAAQKKAYRMLQVVAESESAAARSIVGSRLSELLQLLTDSRSVSLEASLKPRLRTIAVLLSRMKESQQSDEQVQETLKGLLAEVQLSMRAANSDARRTARSLLTQLALCWHETVRGRDVEVEEELAETLTELQDLLTAGVNRLPAKDASADAHHLSLVTADALIALIQSPTFRPVVAGTHVRQIVTFCADRLVSSRNQTVARGGLNAMTEVVTVCSSNSLPLDAVMAALDRIVESHRRALRFDVKAVLLKVMRRVGVPLVLELIPDYLRFPFVRIARTELRKARKTDRRKREDANGKKEEEGEEEEEDEMEAEIAEAGMLPRLRQPQTLDQLLDDSEEEEEEKGRKSAPGRAKRKAEKEKDGLWLEEAPGEVLDLLSTDVAGKIHTKAPVTAAAAGAKKKKTEEFPISEDGRMIICDPEDDESESESEDETEQAAAAASVGKGAKQVRPWRQNVKTKKKREPGEQFRSARARGDMKRGGGPDPYAFLKLRGVSKKDISVLMKKKRSKGVLGRKKRQ